MNSEEILQLANAIEFTLSGWGIEIIQGVGELLQSIENTEDDTLLAERMDLVEEQIDVLREAIEEVRRVRGLT